VVRVCLVAIILTRALFFCALRLDYGRSYTKQGGSNHRNSNALSCYFFLFITVCFPEFQLNVITICHSSGVNCIPDAVTWGLLFSSALGKMAQSKPLSFSN